MAGRTAPQLNIRSAFARERADALSRATGLSVTQVVEEALRRFEPSPPPTVGRLVRKGSLLVLPAGPGTPPITRGDTLREIMADRDERGERARPFEGG